MNIYFLRHGETAYNAAARMQGQVDIPLNEKGLAQAEMAARYFEKHGIRFDHVISSPLTRAVQTAVIVSGRQENEIVRDQRLTELGFGEAEGQNFHEIPAGWRNFILNPPAYELPKGAEPLEALFERCESFLKYLALQENLWDAGANLLVATHGAAIRGFMKVIDHTPLEAFWVRGIENCCCVCFKLSHGVYTQEAVLHTLPDHAHMHGWQNA